MKCDVLIDTSRSLLKALAILDLVLKALVLNCEALKLSVSHGQV